MPRESEADKHDSVVLKSRRPAWASFRQAAFIAAISLAMHGLFLAEDRYNPTLWHPIVDAQEYDETARLIVAGEWTTQEPYWHPPLYLYFLAAVYALGNGTFLSAKIAHTLVGTATCVLGWVIGRRLFGKRVGLLAGLLLACWGPLIFYNTQMLPAGLTVFLNLLVVYLLLRAVERPAWHRWLASGGGTGLAALALPNILVLLPVLAAWLIAAGIWRRSIRMPVHALLYVIGTLVVIAPVTMRNYVVSGQFVPISVNGGINLYISNNPDSFHTIGIRPGRQWERLRREPELHGITTWREADRYFYRKALTYMREQPGDFLKNLLGKTRLFFNAREIPRNLDLYMHRDYSHLLRALTWRWGPVGCPFGIMAPLAALGLIVACRADKRSWLLVAYMAAYSGSVILFFVSARHRLPIVPVIAIFAGCGLTWLAGALRARRYRAAGGAAALMVLVGLLVNWPVAAPTDGVNFLAEMHHFIGVRAIRLELFDIADRQLSKAIELEPLYPEANVSLGGLRLQQGQVHVASQHFRRALTLAPDYPEAHQGLGAVAMMERRWADAERHFRDALDILPVLHDSRYYLGLALVKQGRLAEAAEQFRTAIRLGADDPRFTRALIEHCRQQSKPSNHSQPAE